MPFHSRSSHRSSSLVALNALFLDDSINHANTDSSSSSMTTSMPLSISSANLADWNPLQKDIVHWLTTVSSYNNNANNMLTMESTNILSTITTTSSSTILSVASSSTPQATADRPPTNEEVALLQTAFASFYGEDRTCPRRTHC